MALIVLEYTPWGVAWWLRERPHHLAPSGPPRGPNHSPPASTCWVKRLEWLPQPSPDGELLWSHWAGANHTPHPPKLGGKRHSKATKPAQPTTSIRGESAHLSLQDGSPNPARAGWDSQSPNPVFRPGTNHLIPSEAYSTPNGSKLGPELLCNPMSDPQHRADLMWIRINKLQGRPSMSQPRVIVTVVLT